MFLPKVDAPLYDLLLEDVLKLVADVSKTLDPPKSSDKLEDFDSGSPSF